MNNTAIQENHIRKELLYDDIELIIYDMTYPEIAGMDYTVRKKINNRIKQEQKRKLDYLNQAVYPLALRQYNQAQAAGAKFISYDYYLRSTLSDDKADFLSFYIDSVLNIYHSGPIYKKESMTFGKRDGELLSLADFFIKGSRYKEIILNGIAQQIQNRINSGCAVYHENWQIEMLKYFNIRNYYLTPRGFCIYYEPYNIAGGQLGYNTFEIEYNLLTHVLDQK